MVMRLVLLVVVVIAIVGIEQKKPFHSYIATEDGKFFIHMVSKRQTVQIPTN